MAKAKRIYIEPNISQDAKTGRYEARFSVAGDPQCLHFPPDTSLVHIRARIKSRQEELTDEIRAFGELTPKDRVRAVGTLEGDAPDFWAQTSGKPGSQADVSHLRAWFDVVVDGVRLGSLARDAWTAAHVNKTIVQWQTAPSPLSIRKVRVGGYAREAVRVDSFTIAPATVRTHARIGKQAGVINGYQRKGSVIAAHDRRANAVGGYVRAAPVTSGRVVSTLTIRHRCRVLADLYRTLDGKSAPTPVDDAKVPTRKKTKPITVPETVIVNTLLKLAQIDAKTFGRFAVVNTCAQRPCQVGRALPDDVDLVHRTWLVREAKGEDAHIITLDDPQVAAWQAFIAADAWGEFDTSKYGKLIHEAGWPKSITPYKARHSFSANAISRGVSLGDLQAQLGHTDPNTTRIYAPFQVDRQRVISAQMKDYLADVFKPRLVKK